MKLLVKRLVILLLVLGVAGGGYAMFGKNKKSKKDEVTYEYGTVGRGDVRSFVTATGVIQPWKIVDVKSNVAGRIDRFGPENPADPNGKRIDLGSRVKEGQLIAMIDPTDTKTAFDQASADLKSAEARKAQAIINLKQQKAQTRARVAAAKQAVAAAKARLASADESRKVQPLLTDSAISQAKANLSSAQKAVAQAQQSKEQLEQQLKQLREVTIPLNIETVESNLEQAKANLQTADAEYQRQRNLQGMGYVALSDVQTAYARMATNKAAVRTAEQRKQTLRKENDLQVKELQARIDEAAARIEAQSAGVEQAQAALKIAQSNAVQNVIQVRAYEAAQAALDQAMQDEKAAEAELNQIQFREREIETADAQIVRGKAAVDQAKTNLGYTEIRAPRTGIVITKSVEEGTVVPSSRASIGSTNALLQIGDVSRLWVVCDVDETDIGQVTVGQKVTVKVDAYPSLLIDGKVIRIDPQAKVEQNVTLIPVTVEIAEPDPRFLPGMNATCEFIVDEVTNVVTVPNEALKESDGIYKVQVKTGGKPKEVEVEVGLAGPDVTEIRSGLNEGEEVVTRTIEPEKAEANNPFNPFGGMGRGGRGGGGGGRGGGGGGGRGGR